MARTTVPPEALRRPDRVERAIAYGTIALTAAVLAAVLAGRRDWTAVPAVVWLHLATVTVALVLTPVLLLRARGTRSHRQLGWAWAVSMIATALVTVFVRLSNPGGFSPIHILTVVVLIAVPLLVLAARRHDVVRHRRSARALTIGAIIVAGFFTFPFDRLLGHWLFG